MPVCERAENCEGPAVAALFLGGRCPCCAGRVGAAGAFCGCERPCDHTATRSCLFNSLVPQIQFTARVVDILLYNRYRYAAFIRGVMAAVNGLLDAFCVIFRAPPVVPELSASFSSPRALTPVSARGLQRVCELMTVVRWTYTHS